MICRNPKFALEAQIEIQDVSKNQNIYAHIVNMSDPKAVLVFANRFKEPLNVLINNAGCMINKRILTQDGFEKNFATNTLGTHVLTQNLIPNLRKTNLDQKSRVIIVSSGERPSTISAKIIQMPKKIRPIYRGVKYLVRDIKPPKYQSCFPQFFPQFFLSLSS